jgi:hypothetical protein
MSIDQRGRAVERLEQAEREQERLTERYASAGAKGGSLRADTELRGAREETDARRRWLEWVESDGQGSGQSQAVLEELGSR